MELLEITPEHIAAMLQLVNPHLPYEFATLCAWQIFDHIGNDTHALAQEELKSALDYTEQDALDYLANRDN